MQVGHKIDDCFRYRVSDFTLSRQQQAGIENFDCAGMTISGCAAISGIDVFRCAGRKIMAKQLCV